MTPRSSRVSFYFRVQRLGWAYKKGFVGNIVIISVTLAWMHHHLPRNWNDKVNSSVIRQKGESQNGGNKKAKHAKFLLFDKRRSTGNSVNSITWKEKFIRIYNTLKCQLQVILCSPKWTMELDEFSIKVNISKTWTWLSSSKLYNVFPRNMRISGYYCDFWLKFYPKFSARI